MRHKNHRSPAWHRENRPQTGRRQAAANPNRSGRNRTCESTETPLHHFQAGLPQEGSKQVQTIHYGAPPFLGDAGHVLR
jgi:hypothetical protein